ncbi:MAG: 5-methyltetrahydropteroyltriglutamate--homocysteine S-methyltransferase [Chthoniobacteraceae bacterium]
MKILTHNLGFPRIGRQRELKKALESYWSGRSTSEDLNKAGRQIRQHNWRLQQAAGIDLIPSNDFSFYDHVLDTCALVGAVPSRFGRVEGNVGLDTYFAMARGRQETWAGSPGDDVLRNTVAGSLPADSLQALEMTKWFDTNYHYLVPEFHAGQQFRLSSEKPFDEWLEARALGIETMPVLLGPVTFLLLGKNCEDAAFDPLTLLHSLLPVYEWVLQKLYMLGANWVQFDEPILSCDLSPAAQSALRLAYATLRNASPSSKILLANYFGDLGQNRATALQLPVDAFHLDVVRASTELDAVVRELPGQMSLSLGVVDGRNVWANDLSATLQLLGRAGATLGSERLIISPSCSLLHVPVSLAEEKRLDPELKIWLAFAEEKLGEVKTLARIAGEESDLSELELNVRAIGNRKSSPRRQNVIVRERCEQLSGGSFRRKSAYPARRKAQAARFILPVLPTTTIGSFPQTAELRRTRAKFKRGEIGSTEYERFLEESIRDCVRRQEELGLDVLVHGEPERTDMVEYFGEQLDGIAITQNGWVQSYGSRCVKPPVIYGDVSRPHPMTVRWSKFAQALTAKPMKGMLTGPVTLLQWSFVRDDQPRSVTAKQLALAIRDEVLDLEAAGIGIIQIDEPALREGLPLRRDRWGQYLHWAVEAFHLTVSGVQDATQIHTHMCYSEFSDIMPFIIALDADVISIEAARSGMDLLRSFALSGYPNGIGPGVWDVHSPRVPSTLEFLDSIYAATAVLPLDRLWVNPDCGLKTRGWEEVTASLQNMVQTVRRLRDGGNGKNAAPAREAAALVH